MFNKVIDMSGFAYSRDYEIVQRMRPEPMTESERAAQARIADLDLTPAPNGFAFIHNHDFRADVLFIRTEITVGAR